MIDIKKDLIIKSLTVLEPSFVDVINESHMHSRGHDTHYKIVVVSQDFENLKQVSRHQKIYTSLKTLMQDIHALAIHAYTPQEWKTSAIVTASPTCLGGGKL